jgi:hypothetical protein
VTPYLTGEVLPSQTESQASAPERSYPGLKRDAAPTQEAAADRYRWSVADLNPRGGLSAPSLTSEIRTVNGYRSSKGFGFSRPTEARAERRSGDTEADRSGTTMLPLANTCQTMR